MGNKSPLKNQVFKHRCAGILLHPTSLPYTENYCDPELARGTLGREAYKFIDFMAAANLTVWQVLPLGPTQPDLSPYQSISAHAGNPDLISLADLCERGWVNVDDCRLENESPDRLPRLRRQCARSFFDFIKQDQGAGIGNEFKNFCHEQSYWLDDFALFCALRAYFNNTTWPQWPKEFRWRDQKALAEIKKDLADDINFYLFEQFAFSVQWRALKAYAHKKNISIFGDMPIFVGHDSADVWAQPHYFKLDGEGYPLVVAGVPPDSFSETGQRWGNPLYAWDVMQKDGFQWWLARFRSQLRFFDLIRIDHFRGFDACWEIPADKEDARTGEWVKVPGEALLHVCLETYPDLVLVAENLGMITEEVEQLRNEFHLPGMLVLHFAFEDDSDSPHLPHRHTVNNIIYTGTHDNNTTVGWYKELSASGRQQLRSYSYDSAVAMPWLLIRMAFSSACSLAIIPMQDFLGLDENSRMNTPATTDKNWRWKFSWEQVDANLAHAIKDELKKYHRSTKPIA